MNNEEVERLLSVFIPMTDYETRDFIYLKRRHIRGFTRDFSEALGLKVDGVYEGVLINNLGVYLADIRINGRDEPEPEPIPEPEPETPTGECTGCGGNSDVPEGLRWKKLNDQSAPLTISVDHSGKPSNLSWLSSELILAYVQPWVKANKKINLQMLQSGKGDVHIKFEHVDGPNNTLAYVWQPSGSAEYMSSAGDLSGDMVIDNSETNWPQILVQEVIVHEFGHALGLGHGSSPKDVMYPSARGEKKPLSTNDLKELNKRYPK